MLRWLALTSLDCSSKPEGKWQRELMGHLNGRDIMEKLVLHGENTRQWW